MASPTVVGLDIGRDVIHLDAFDATGQVAFRRKVKRLQLVATFKKAPSGIVAIKASLSAQGHPLEFATDMARNGSLYVL